MGKLPVVSGEDAVRALTKLGFVPVRQSGSHVVLQRQMESSSTNTVVVPNHTELAKGTLRSILRKAGLSVEDFTKLL